MGGRDAMNDADAINHTDAINRVSTEWGFSLFGEGVRGGVGYCGDESLAPYREAAPHQYGCRFRWSLSIRARAVAG